MLDPKVLRELLAYDPETGVLTWRERARKWFPSDHAHETWNARFAGRPALTAKRMGYRAGSILRTQCYAHRAAFAVETGRWPEAEIDHINGDRADNRWGNLREATRSGQMQNTARRSNNTSGHVGVSWCAPRKLWTAMIKQGGQASYLGGFPRKEDAATAYRAAKRRLHTFNPELRETANGR